MWALDPNYTGPADQQTVVENLLNLLNGPVVPVQCQQSSAPACSFAKACEAVQVNTGAPFIYDNGRGGRLPNPSIAAIAQLVLQCSQSSSMLGGLLPPDQGPAPEVMMNTSNPMITMARANAEFRRFLVTQPANVQQDMNKVELAMADIQVEAAESAQPTGGMGGDIGFSPLPDPAEQLQEAVSRAGVTLPDELREKWIEAQNTIRSSMGGMYGAPPPAASADTGPQIPLGIQELLDDPFNNPIATWTGPRRDNAVNVFNVRSAEARSRTEGIRGRLIAFMETRARNNPSQAQALNGMIARLRTVIVNLPMGGTPDAMKSCPSPNAFYDPTKHSIVICPQMIGMPMEQLEFAIAHEMGHAVDPCNASLPLNQISGSAEVGYSILEGTPGTPVSSTELVAGTPYNENPFSEVLVCLGRNDSMRAPPVRRSESRRVTREVLRRSRGGMGDVDELKEAHKTVGDFAETHAGCDMLPGQTKQQEAFADWLAAEVATNIQPGSSLLDLGTFLLTDCPTGDISDNLRPVFTYLSSRNCLPSGMEGVPAGLSMSETLSQMQVLSQWEQAVHDSHPPAIDRVNRLMLQNNQLRNQIGCNRAPSGRYCAP